MQDGIFPGRGGACTGCHGCAFFFFFFFFFFAFGCVRWVGHVVGAKCVVAHPKAVESGKLGDLTAGSRA
eukprot:2480398-Prymnesium_polylepis.1